MLVEIKTPAAPEAVGPYSQAVKVGNLLFVSGQLPIDPVSGAIKSDNAVDQAAQCLRNIAAIAEAAGADLSGTAKVTIMLTDLSQFSEVNRVYADFFKAPYPARATFEVSALPKGALVEMEAVILLG